MWLGPWPGLSISEPDLVRQVLRNPHVFQKPDQETIKIFIGGLPSLEGQKWANHRKIANPAFHLHKLKVYIFSQIISFVNFCIRD